MSNDNEPKRSLKDFCEEMNLKYERVRSVIKYDNLPTLTIKKPGRPPERALAEETENYIIAKLARIDARKGTLTSAISIIISFINQKGGVAKTTSAVNVCAALAMEGYSVLLVDCDPQASTTQYMFGEELNPALMNVLHDNVPIKNIIRKCEKFDVVPANLGMANADLMLSQEISREFLLKNALEGLNYDYIILDGPPSLGLLSLNALTASDYVVFPLMPDGMSLFGLNQLLNIINAVKGKINKNLKTLGVVVTRFKGNTNVAKESDEFILKHFGDTYFKTKIRENVKLSECVLHRKDIFSYDPSCNGAEDYKALTQEILERIAKDREL